MPQTSDWTCPTCDVTQPVEADEDGFPCPDSAACADPKCTLSLCPYCVDDEEHVRTCEGCKRLYHVEHLQHVPGQGELCRVCREELTRREEVLEGQQNRGCA